MGGDACADRPAGQVHLDPHQRLEEFRHTSVVTPYATEVVAGHGIDGYRMALGVLAAGLLEPISQSAESRSSRVLYTRGETPDSIDGSLDRRRHQGRGAPSQCPWTRTDGERPQHPPAAARPCPGWAYPSAPAGRGTAAQAADQQPAQSGRSDRGK